jgi:PucR C-terminal helix-turn-helix domain
LGEFGVLRLLTANSTPPEALAFSRDLLRPLVAHDAESGTDLTVTMRVFLEQGGRVRATAKSLGVHENTIRYRLARVRELSALDPDRMETLLDLRFAFQVLDLSGEDLPFRAVTSCDSEPCDSEQRAVLAPEPSHDWADQHEFGAESSPYG